MDRLQLYYKQVPLASRTTNIAQVSPCNCSMLHEAAISLFDKLLCYKIIIREQQSDQAQDVIRFMKTVTKIMIGRQTINNDNFL